MNFLASYSAREVDEQREHDRVNAYERMNVVKKVFSSVWWSESDRRREKESSEHLQRGV